MCNFGRNRNPQDFSRNLQDCWIITLLESSHILIWEKDENELKSTDSTAFIQMDVLFHFDTEKLGERWHMTRGLQVLQ